MLCPYCRGGDKLIKKGSFQRKTGLFGPSYKFFCKTCRRGFSTRTGTLIERQRRPELNEPVYNLLVSGVSQRRIARLLGTTQKTVARKLVRLSRFAEHFQHQENFRQRGSVAVAVFDEMETFEHSKLKPLSIAVAVDEASRRIIAASASSMPSKGLLAAASRRKYGYRHDDRARGLGIILMQVGIVSAERLTVKSDQCPRYPRAVKKHLGRAKHETYKGRRGCVVGLGELKAGGFDPLFALNHTCAMFRDNTKRLARKTWCTTKRPDRLQCLLNLYTCAHNDHISLQRRKAGESRPKRFLESTAGHT